MNGITADFSTTTAAEKIVSQITLMYSVQEYFDFKMTTRCRIPAVEMLGTEEDWSTGERSWFGIGVVESSGKSVQQVTGYLPGETR